jgi:hypothetical protein
MVDMHECNFTKYAADILDLNWLENKCSSAVNQVDKQQLHTNCYLVAPRGGNIYSQS